MKWKARRGTGQSELFKARLDQIIDLRHEPGDRSVRPAACRVIKPRFGLR
jgi:hypothetical protein